MAKVSVATERSFRKAAAAIARAAKKMQGDLGPNLRMIGEEIMTDVKASAPGHGVPVDKGTLRNTGRVEGPTGSKGAPKVSLSFGGPAAKYALVQHEVTTFKHTVGEARYLVRGMERWKPGGSSAMQAIQENARAGLAAVAKRFK